MEERKDIQSVSDDEIELQKKRSHNRIFKAFIVIDLLLLGYLIYSLIMLFTHL